MADMAKEIVEANGFSNGDSPCALIHSRPLTWLN